MKVWLLLFVEAELWNNPRRDHGGGGGSWSGHIFNALTLFFCDWHNAILRCNLSLGATAYCFIFSLCLNADLLISLLRHLFSQMIERGPILTSGSACFSLVLVYSPSKYTKDFFFFPHVGLLIDDKIVRKESVNSSHSPLFPPMWLLFSILYHFTKGNIEQ